MAAAPLTWVFAYGIAAVCLRLQWSVWIARIFILLCWMLGFAFSLSPQQSLVLEKRWQRILCVVLAAGAWVLTGRLLRHYFGEMLAPVFGEAKP
jgi:hypothetical protein